MALPALRRLEAKPVMTSVNRASVDALTSLAYEELRRLAASVRRDDPGATLNPTALVHEAWIKLASSPHFTATSPLHFRRIAARAMRQVLVEAARERHAAKRGGVGLVAVTLDDQVHGNSSAAEILGLDSALQRLAELHPRQGAMVEARFFGGLEIPEIAALLEVSEATVQRDWRAARAWLAIELAATT
jgi:RNA polymerase sigma factor (TIGR02999 family)